MDPSLAAYRKLLVPSMDNEMGDVPARNGEAATGVSAPVVWSMAKAEMLLARKLATYKKRPDGSMTSPRIERPENESVQRSSRRSLTLGSGQPVRSLAHREKPAPVKSTNWARAMWLLSLAIIVSRMPYSNIGQLTRVPALIEPSRIVARCCTGLAMPGCFSPLGRVSPSSGPSARFHQAL